MQGLSRHHELQLLLAINTCSACELVKCQRTQQQEQLLTLYLGAPVEIHLDQLIQVNVGIHTTSQGTCGNC